MQKDKIVFQLSFYFLIIMRGKVKGERSKAWDCGRLFAGVAGSNPAGGKDVSLVSVVYFVSREVSASG